MAELTPDEHDLLARIRDKAELRPFFFRKAKGLKWFDALDQDGYFSPSSNPKPIPAKEEGYVNVPFWPVTEYLVATSAELQEPTNQAYAEKFLGIVRAVTQYAVENEFSNYRTWWQLSKVIQNVPSYLITSDDLNLFNYWLDDPHERSLVAETLGEHLLADLLDRNDAHCKGLAIGLLSVLFEVKYVDKRYGQSNRQEAALRFDSWHARRIIKKVAPKAGQVLGRQAVELFQNALEQTLNKLEKDGWSALWRAAVEDHEQNHGADDAEDILIEGFRDALLAFVNNAPAEAKSYVMELLARPYETTKRIAIYAIDQCYQQLGELAGKVFSKEYFTSNFRHEMWHLLHNHYAQLTLEDRTRLLNMIGRFVEEDENGQQHKGATNYERAIWLSAIHEFGDKEGAQYLECIEVVGGEPEHPDFSSYTTSGWVDHESPIPKDELLSMQVDELVKRLKSYKDPGKFREPGLEGLTKALRQIVKASPTRYSSQLNKFAGLDLAYIYQLLEAYGELWREKVLLPWEEIWQSILTFCEQLINQKRFWAPKSVQERSQFVANRYWVVGSIARLIEDGTRSDEHAFSEKLLDQALTVLIVLLKQEKGEKFKPDSDAVSIAINSPRGRALEAFINLGLRSCRLADKQDSGHIEVWKKLEPIFDAELARSNIGEYEFSTLVVNYLPNFLYMSKEWLLANLSNIFDQADYQKWLCAMNGYVYVNAVYREIYDHLKHYGHFIQALDDENLKSRATEKIVQNIVIGFFSDFEALEDESSLIHQLLERKNSDELSQLIWFIWTFRKDGDSKTQSKVYELWPCLLAVIDTSCLEGKKLASRLSTWSVFINEVNELNKPLVHAVASYAEDDYNSHDLLEMIARVSRSQPQEAYEIWSRLLEGSSTDFPEEAVRASLGNLVKAGAAGKRYANDIVSRYLTRGNERPLLWLKEIASDAT